MADFTKLSDGDIATLADAFELGSVAAWSSIAAGTINSNFAVDCASGRFFLRVNEGKSREDVAYEAAVVEAMADGGVPTPRPLQVAGQPFFVFGDKLVSVFPWVVGRHIDQVSPAAARAVGAALAELHRVGRGLVHLGDHRGIYTFEHIVSRAETFRDCSDDAVAAANPLIGDEIDWHRRQGEVEQPTGVIHGDLFPDNVLFAAGDVVALLDFEQACVGGTIYDLAVCINAWCYGDGFEPGLVAAMVQGYCAGAEPIDGGALHQECRRAALRFAVTRITDVHLVGATNSGKDFRLYLDRLTWWRDAGPVAARRLFGLSAG